MRSHSLTETEYRLRNVEVYKVGPSTFGLVCGRDHDRRVYPLVCPCLDVIALRGFRPVVLLEERFGFPAPPARPGHDAVVHLALVQDGLISVGRRVCIVNWVSWELPLPYSWWPPDPEAKAAYLISQPRAICWRFERLLGLKLALQLVQILNQIVDLISRIKILKGGHFS